jgi:hypothetical protein
MTIEKPNEEARKEMMRAARGKSKSNSFFIFRETGEIKQATWRDDNSYFSSIPKGTYEIHIRKCPFCSYSDLDAQIENTVAMLEQNDEMELEAHKRFLKEIATFSEERIQAEYGFSSAKIAELREEAKAMGVA